MSADRNVDPAAQALEVGGRLREGPSERLVGIVFRRELEDQLELFDAMGQVDLAHTLMLREAGVIPETAAAELLAALLRLQERPPDFRPEPRNGDLYTNREVWLTGQTGAAVWLGAGRARREATTTAFLIRLRDELLNLVPALLAAGRVLSRRAREFADAPMADHTYLLAAQPSSFGHYLLGFAFPLRRDLERLQSLYTRLNRSPAGCGSTNGSRYPLDRHRLAELLGFDGLVTHGRDAMWQADLPVETQASLTMVLLNLDRLAEDLQIFSTEAHALLELDDGHARASKILPQKKNPFALTHVRGCANRMIGELATSAAMGRTPSAQPDNRLSLYGSLPRAIEDCRTAVELMAEVIERLRFDRERARNQLEQSFAAASDLAELLGLHCGLGYREAHRLVGHLVQVCAADGDFSRLSPRAVEAAARQVLGRRIEVPDGLLAIATDPVAALAARTAPGGAAAAALAEMLAACERDWAEAETWSLARRGRLLAAEAVLRAESQRWAR